MKNMKGKCWFLVAILFVSPFIQHNSIMTKGSSPSFAPYQVTPEEPSELPSDYGWTNLKTAAAFGGVLSGTSQSGNNAETFDFGIDHEFDVDADGNWYFMGEFRETIQIGNTTLVPVEKPDIFVAKYSAAGEWVWANAIHGGNQYGDYGHALQVHNDGSVYVTGEYRANVTLGPFTLVSTIHDVPREEVFVAKLTPDGEWAWATSGGGSWVDVPKQMELTPEGDVVLLGTSFADVINPVYGETEFTNRNTLSFVAKLSKHGDWLWAHQYGLDRFGSGSIRDAMHVDANGSIYIATKADVYSDTGQPLFGELAVEQTENTSRTYITKILPNGTFSWLKSFNTTRFFIEDIATNSDGDLFFGGYWHAECDKVNSNDELQTLSYNESKYDRGLVAKMTQDGDLVWASHIHGTGYSSVTMLTVDEQENLFVAGMVRWGKTKLGKIETENDGKQSFVSKISNDGVWEWSAFAKGGYTGFNSADGGIQSIEHREGEVFVSGFFGEDGGILSPYSVNVQHGIVHFSANVAFYDEDKDGVGDSTDRCMSGATGWVSTNETDMDGDGCRDADEDDDDDNDGILDVNDNCPGYDNSQDMDCDRIPDWEDDSDGDGIVDQDDACPGENDRLDTDRDEIPDCQDDDDDDDGIYDLDDACPLYDQEIDWNCNGINDFQDDSDDDGVVDRYDACQGSDDNVDMNENGVPDGCDDPDAFEQSSENTSTPVDDQTNNTNTSTLDEEAGASIATTALAAGGSALALLVLGAVMLSRKRKEGGVAPMPVLDIAQVEAYVQQLVELGHPENIARAHAIAHYSNENEQ